MIPAILIVLGLVALVAVSTIGLYYLEVAWYGVGIAEDDVALQSAHDDEVVIDDTEPDFV